MADKKAVEAASKLTKAHAQLAEAIATMDSVLNGLTYRACQMNKELRDIRSQALCAVAYAGQAQATLSEYE